MSIRTNKILTRLLSQDLVKDTILDNADGDTDMIEDKAKEAQSGAHSLEIWDPPNDLTTEEWALAHTTPFSGLENLGNSCYMNSILQVLMHTPQLVGGLLLHAGQRCVISDAGEFCLACQLRYLVGYILFTNEKAVSPCKIFHGIPSFTKDFPLGTQQDAHEFFLATVNSLQRTAQIHLEESTSRTWVDRLFQGALRTTIICHGDGCETQSENFEPFYQLSLGLEDCDTLEQMMERFCRVESLKDRRCPDCEEWTSDLQMSIHLPPTMLCIQLKRYTNTTEKIDKAIAYPDVLDILTSGDMQQSTYHLHSVVFHDGNTVQSGHYFAFVRGVAGKWWKLNDTDTEQLDGPLRNDPRAYVLFYMRQ